MNRFHPRTGRRPLPLPRRRGVALVIVLLLLAVISMILATVLTLSALDRRAAARHWPTAEAYWLAESGLERAAARLARDPTYRGETWQPTAAELGAPDNEATVEIHVAPQGAAGRYTVHIQADCPRDAARRARIEKNVTIDRRQLSGAQQ
ncbi:MAG: hypothetical protein K8T25_11620 [Planctomycetia bacterium]|nr:hypothetical protein [Planctomycetia bacterium]